MSRELTHNRFGQVSELNYASGVLGLNDIEKQLVVPYLWFTPGTSDPDSPVAITIVKATQNGLRKLGLQTRGDGYIDEATSYGLRTVSGPRWKAKAWSVVFSDLIGAIRRGVRIRPLQKRAEGLGVYMTAMGDVSLGNIGFTARGTAFGKDSATEAIFRSLQNQLNRIASVTDNFGKLMVDGKIGKNTVAAVVAAENKIGMSVVPSHTQRGVAMKADVAAQAFRRGADQLGAAARVAPSTSRKHAGGSDDAVKPDASREGGVTLAPDDFVSKLSSPTGLIAIGAGTLGLLVFGDQLRAAISGKPKRKKRRR